MKLDKQNYSLNAFGLLVRQHRQMLGLSQRQLAELASTTQTAVAQIEAGTGNPTLDKLERLALGLKTDLNIRLTRQSKIR